MTDQDAEAVLRKQAERRTDAKFGFWRHAGIYAVVNTGLAAINLYTSPQTLWFLFPLLGWGFGLLMHGLAVFQTLSGLREKSVQAEMERLRRRGG